MGKGHRSFADESDVTKPALTRNKLSLSGYRVGTRCDEPARARADTAGRGLGDRFIQMIFIVVDKRVQNGSRRRRPRAPALNSRRRNARKLRALNFIRHRRASTRYPRDPRRAQRYEGERTCSDGGRFIGAAPRLSRRCEFFCKAMHRLHRGSLSLVDRRISRARLFVRSRSRSVSGCAVTRPGFQLIPC
ncbi:hypothetical protein EVAR_87004_1 [Eumeta japonica]|uniref:Uncharacterized protein n=1 Tax=Eumeta variegata TaxID=151549 RepID=A0A4C1W7A1_EUMVA|nr:hypothetical protein EVAR_87004_1 [Eumeta japonica]